MNVYDHIYIYISCNHVRPTCDPFIEADMPCSRAICSVSNDLSLCFRQSKVKCTRVAPTESATCRSNSSLAVAGNIEAMGGTT